MKRFMMMVLGGLMLSAVLSAGEAAPRPAAGGMRIAVIRLSDVFTKYERVKAMQEDVKNAMQPDKLAIEKLEAELGRLGDDMRTDNNANRESLEWFEKVQTVEKLKYTIKMRKDAFGREFNSKMVAHYKVIFADLQSAIAEYSTANGIDLVLRAAEMDKLEGESVPAIQGEITLKVVHYFAPSIDSTDAILEIMNRNYKKLGLGGKASAPAGKGK